jgi:hypothetical protein
LLYLSAASRAHTLNNLRRTNFYEVSWMPGSEPRVDRLQAVWTTVARLRPEQRNSFHLMDPQPTTFFSTFGPGLGSRLGRDWFSAHPDTSLRFTLPAGAHHLSAEFMLDAGAYDPALKPQDMTDGVTFDVNEVLAGGGIRELYTRFLNPREQAADRGPQVITVDFTLEKPGEVELLIGPGPSGRNARDWALLGPVKFD